MGIHEPQLSKRAFWDTNMSSIDYVKHAKFVVEKIVERGTHQDFINILKFYGFEEVKQLVLKANWLSDISINFCCTLFRVKPTDFKCYEKKQLNQEHWNF